MYSAAVFLEKYKVFERWAVRKNGEDGVKSLEQNHYNASVRQEIRYFRHVRNLLSHNPNGCEKPLIELTDEFKERFEHLCNGLMNIISEISVPYKSIYKREMNDKVLPTINVMKQKSYSYVPVMNGKKVWGVFSETGVFNLVGDGKIPHIDEELPLLKIKDYITEYSKNGFFEFVKSDVSIDDIRRVFSDATNEGRRLDVLYITTSGDVTGDLMGLVTVWDISGL